MKWILKEAEWLKKNINNYSRKELADKLNKSESQIRGYCYLYQIKKTKRGKKVPRGKYIRVSKKQQLLNSRKSSLRYWNENKIILRRHQKTRYLNRNKELHNEYHRNYYLKNKEKICEVMKIWRKNNREKLNEKRRIYYKKNLKKIKAKNKVKIAVRKGLLKKQPCLLCNKMFVHAHHPDYSSPLKIIWLCVACHKYIHRLLRIKNKLGGLRVKKIYRYRKMG